MTNVEASVRAGRVTTEGDELYYEVCGRGEPLLMIAGGGGDAGFYSLVADILGGEYEVITYDRRANSRSTGHDPLNFDFGQQARDAAAVLRAAGHESAYVFGSSGGAIVALEMARSLPHTVRAAIAHEPPTLRMVPDSDELLACYADIFRTAFLSGAKAAMREFTASLRIPKDAYARAPKEFLLRIRGNNDYFVKHEMLPFANYKPDAETIRAHGVPVRMAAGTSTLAEGLYYGRTAVALAERLGRELAALPGHHLSYLDRPEEWAAGLSGHFRRLREDG